ncbi:hypothetical protein BU25DRAFT_298191, partial [Macroventuria anomochaeta]
PATITPTAHTAKEAISIARNMVTQASKLADTHEEQTRLLDLLEVFRDFTENNRVNKHGVSVLASQVSNLESVSRSLGSKVKQLQKPTTATTATTATPPEPTQPSPPTRSYATTASNSQPKTTDWQLVGNKKTPAPTPKNSLSTRQLVLLQEHPAPFNSLQLRNAFNQAFVNKGVSSPVVALVTPSAKQNIVLTTTPTFTAKYLLENQDIWQTLTPFKEALPIQPWYNVVVHNIPTSFSTNEQVQQTGSVCIAFATEQEAQRAIRSRLYLLGISVRVEKLHSTPASSQCQKCQRFGHTETKCSNTTACKICAEPHPTTLHKCNTCGAKGKSCVHTVPVCMNCKGAHTADNK